MFESCKLYTHNTCDRNIKLIRNIIYNKYHYSKERSVNINLIWSVKLGNWNRYFFMGVFIAITGYLKSVVFIINSHVSVPLLNVGSPDSSYGDEILVL